MSIASVLARKVLTKSMKKYLLDLLWRIFIKLAINMNNKDFHLVSEAALKRIKDAKSVDDVSKLDVLIVSIHTACDKAIEIRKDVLSGATV